LEESVEMDSVEGKEHAQRWNTTVRRLRKFSFSTIKESAVSEKIEKLKNLC